jgi:putative membrane protein
MYDWLKALHLIAVLAMSAVHGFMAARVRDFKLDRNTRGQKFNRFINEIQMILMIKIVTLVVVKPF